MNKNIYIKWPNDIIVDSFKIAGILIENQWAANKLKSSIVGVGLNINQKEFNTSFSATSLYKLTHKEYVIDEVMLLVIKQLNIYFEHLKNGDYLMLDELYLSNFYRYNIWSNYKSIDCEEFEGKIIGVSKDGLIVIEKKNGTSTNYDLKEISFI